MTIRNLDGLLHPASVAVVGIDRPHGATVLDHVRAGGFPGPVWAVGAPGAGTGGVPTFASIAELPEPPGLAVLAGPFAEVPARIGELGAKGGRLAVVLDAEGQDAAGVRQAMLDAARPHLVRIIGPHTPGVIVPAARLDASTAPIATAPGGLALVSQSGTIATALLDWAASHAIGFSAVIPIGGMADVDIADCLDLLAGDPRTRAILLYLESIPAPRKFLSAARAAARLKPVIALKAGRAPQAAVAVETHTGRLAGADAVVDAALRRAGILRVEGLAALFAAAETVARFRPMQRARVAIVTNSGGAGVLAADGLAAAGSPLAALAPETLGALPADCSRQNPVDLDDEAGPERYVAALDALAADRGVDAILAMHAPTAPGTPLAIAEALVARTEKGRIRGKPVLACWMGGATARTARNTLRAGGIASHDAPSGAVAAVGHLASWGKAQAALLSVPDRRAETALAAAPDAREQVMAIFRAAAAEGRQRLTPREAVAAAAAYGIPVPAVAIAATPEEAGARARELLADGGRVAVKLLSPDVAHKSDLGGVVLDVATAGAAEAAAAAIAARVTAAAPGVRLDGFELQPMVTRPNALELILGVGRDPVFGPTILFGAGGVAVELVRDTAVTLPPLDSGLAAELVGRTRVGAQLAGFRGRPPADVAALHGALIALSHMIEDLPALRALDINPLLADESGVIALDVHVEFDADDLERRAPNPDLAIRPYPAEWRRRLDRPGGPYEIRPIRPADALLYPRFRELLSDDDLRMRFLAVRAHFPEEFALRLSQLDYDREIAFVALTPEGELAGVSRLACDPDHRSAEYSLIVRSDLQGRGLGGALMRLLIDYARADGLERLEGMVLAENRDMQGLVGHLGFHIAFVPEDPGVVMTTLEL